MACEKVGEIHVEEHVARHDDAIGRARQKVCGTANSTAGSERTRFLRPGDPHAVGMVGVDRRPNRLGQVVQIHEDLFDFGVVGAATVLGVHPLFREIQADSRRVGSDWKEEELHGGSPGDVSE